MCAIEDKILVVFEKSDGNALRVHSRESGNTNSMAGFHPKTLLTLFLNQL